MKMCVLALATTFLAAGFAGTSPTDVYLLMGQSNMAGRGVLTADNRLDTTRVVKWNCRTQGGDGDAWIEAVEPIVQDRDFSGAGLAASFARALADDNPSVVIGLVPAAEGDTKLERWMPGGDLYARAIRWTQAALAKGGVLRGILWHQGCGDAGQEATATTYAARLKTIVAALRTDLAAPLVPFVAGELGRYLDELQTDGRPTLGYWRIVNAQLAEAAVGIPRMRLVRSNGLVHKGDYLHFDTPSVRTLGLRYAAAIRDLAQEERTFGRAGSANWFDAHILQYAEWPSDAVYAIGGTWNPGAEELADVVSLDGPGRLALGLPRGTLDFDAAVPKTLAEDAARVVLTTEIEPDVFLRSELPEVDPDWKGGVLMAEESGQTNYYGLASVGGANDWVRLEGVTVRSGATLVKMSLRKNGSSTVVNYDIGGEVGRYGGATDIVVVASLRVNGMGFGGNGTICSAAAAFEKVRRGLLIVVE